MADSRVTILIYRVLRISDLDKLRLGHCEIGCLTTRTFTLKQGSTLLDKDSLRKLPAGPDLAEVLPSVFMSEGGTPEHTDRVGVGLMVYGLVLINDAGLVMKYEGKIIELPVGMVYCIDPTKPHSTIPTGTTPGQRFAIYVQYRPYGYWRTPDEFMRYFRGQYSSWLGDG